MVCRGNNAKLRAVYLVCGTLIASGDISNAVKDFLKVAEVNCRESEDGRRNGGGDGEGEEGSRPQFQTRGINPDSG